MFNLKKGGYWVIANRIYEEYMKAKKYNLAGRLFLRRLIGSFKNRLLYKKLEFQTQSNEKLVNTMHSYYVSKKLAKRFSSELSQKPKDFDESTQFPKIIWWSWLQGEEQAPELAKMCLHSLRKELPDYDIKIVTMDNLADYIDLPQVIIDKFNAGWIAGAHFADIIRLNLLANHGGLWVDSTVYCTDNKLMKDIERSSMFVFRNMLGIDREYAALSNWFIASKKGNPYIKECAQLINKYFMEFTNLEDYFVCHLIMTLLSKKYSKLWNEMPVYNNVDPHMLHMALIGECSFSKEYFYEATQRASFHKLSRHVDTDNNECYLYLRERERQK